MVIFRGKDKDSIGFDMMAFRGPFWNQPTIAWCSTHGRSCPARKMLLLETGRCPLTMTMFSLYTVVLEEDLLYSVKGLQDALSMYKFQHVFLFFLLSTSDKAFPLRRCGHPAVKRSRVTQTMKNRRGPATGFLRFCLDPWEGWGM